MILYFKKLYDDVEIPKYSHIYDAAFDLVSRERHVLYPMTRHLFKLGFATEFDPNYVCHFWDRSGLAINDGVTTLAGVIDAGYRAEWGVVLLNTSWDKSKVIEKGDRIAQAVFQKIERPTITEVVELTPTNRGVGFGSSGS